MQLAPAAQVRQALNLMRTWDVSQIPVIEDGKCIGSLNEGTLMTQALEQPTLLDRPVREVMEEPYPDVELTLPVDRLARCSRANHPPRWCATGIALVGIVSRYDVLQLMIGR